MNPKIIDPPRRPTVRVIAYVDGACSGNPGPGGSGAVLLHVDRDGALQHALALSRHLANTTNNIAELTAVRLAFETIRISLTGTTKIEIRSDSTYVKGCLVEWLPAWQRRQWRTVNGGPVKNAELIQEIVALAKDRRIDYYVTHVRGHSGEPGNEEADRLATLVKLGVQYEQRTRTEDHGFVFRQKHGAGEGRSA